MRMATRMLGRVATAGLCAVALALVVAIVLGPGSAAAASPPAREQRTPTVVFNPDLDHYLAMWVEDRGQGPDIYAKRLFSNGLPQGGAARGGTGVISSSYPSNGGRFDPAITYNADAEEYYLVWSEAVAGEGQNIFGLRVSSAGFGRGKPRELASGPGDETHPAIAYNPDQQEYLVVWEDNTRDIDDIWALRVRSNGVPSGVSFAMVQGVSNSQDPTVARRGDGYLVAWVDDRDGGSDIYARRVNANGLPIGGAQGADYAMASALVDEIAPSLDPSSGTLVYNVYDPLTGLDIVGVQVYDNGATRGSRSVGIAVPAADQASPATAANSARRETLVLYSDNRSGEFDIYGIRVRNSRPSGRDYPVLKDGFAP